MAKVRIKLYKNKNGKYQAQMIKDGVRSQIKVSDARRYVMPQELTVGPHYIVAQPD